VAFGGNIGTPLSELALSGLPDHLVLEISSYQAQGSFLLAPAVSIFTNFSSDHLEMHGTLDEYFKAKMRLVDQTLLGGHFITESHVLDRIQSRGYLFPKNTVLSDQLATSFYDRISSASPLNEPHNVKNAAQAVLGVAALLDRDPEDLLAHLNSFVGLEHRCERVGHVGRCLVINDSKSTNVDSTLTALAAYSGSILLLIGGRPKRESMTPILHHKHKISRILTFGEASEQVKRELSEIPIFELSQIEDLVHFLGEAPLKEDVLLLSPACASFDQFKNFEERGQRFKIVVQQLPGFKRISG
jgi:UDP-N-acetylmuramoylalanine--D-glutamate ligase